MMFLFFLWIPVEILPIENNNKSNVQKINEFLVMLLFDDALKTKLFHFCLACKWQPHDQKPQL